MKKILSHTQLEHVQKFENDEDGVNVVYFRGYDLNRETRTRSKTLILSQLIEDVANGGIELILDFDANEKLVSIEILYDDHVCCDDE